MPMPTPIREIPSFASCPHCKMKVRPNAFDDHVLRCPDELARIRHHFEVANVARLETLYGAGAVERFKRTGSYAQ